MRRLQELLRRGLILAAHSRAVPMLLSSTFPDFSQWLGEETLVDDWWSTRRGTPPNNQQVFDELTVWRSQINLRAAQAREEALLEWREQMSAWCELMHQRRATRSPEPLPPKPPKPLLKSFPLEILRDQFKLTPAEQDCILLTLAPHFNGRYESLYALLQGQASELSVELALNLVCADAADKLKHADLLTRSGTLLRRHLLERSPEIFPHDSPFPLRRHLRLDERMISFLLGRDPKGGDSLSVRKTQAPSELLPLDAPEFAPLQNTAEACSQDRTPWVVRLVGPRRALLEAAAETLAADLGRQWFFVLDLTDSASTPAQVSLALRDAMLYSSAIAVYSSGRGETVRLAESATWEALHSIGTFVFLLGPEDAFPPPPIPADFWQLSFDAPEYERWLRGWTATSPSGLPPDDARDLATDFDLDPTRIDRAVMLARGRAAARHPQNLTPTPGDLRAAARTLGVPRLGRYAIRIAPRYKLKDLVLPPDRLAQLNTLVSRARHRDDVQEMGYGGPGDRGQGLPVLFAGPSGTGKTMAAEIVAGELGLDLFAIDLSSVVSKYIGETEQNLNLIFEATHRAPAVLLLDEADSLCGKRTEIKDAHDRYANLEVNFLLQRIERHSGIVILATNFQQNIDSAFLRRFVDRVDFPPPDEAQRRDLWERQFPEFSQPGNALQKLRERIDFPFLARQFALTGASIRNAVLHAAFAAASRESREVTMLDVIRGVAGEYRKQGRLCSPAEFGHYYKSLREELPRPA